MSTIDPPEVANDTTESEGIQYPSFTETILALGGTDEERAEALGMSRSTFVQRYKDLHLPTYVIRLMRRPETLRALADDAERLLASQANRQAA